MRKGGWTKTTNDTEEELAEYKPYYSRRADNRRRGFYRFEFTRTGVTEAAFEAIEVEARRCEALGATFSCNAYLSMLIAEALAMRRSAKRISNSPIPRMDRYELDGVVGGSAIDAYKNGLIDIDQLTDMFRSTEKLRVEILDNEEIYYKVVDNMTHRMPKSR